MLVRRAADATCLQDLSTRPACGRPTQREDAAPKSPEASIHVPSRRRRTRGGLCDVAPVSEERTPTGALRRRADAAARETLIQFARALASQRPPSRERPPLGGGGAGRALFPSLCVSPFSRSIEDTEHGRRQLRGPPACSSAGTSLRAPRRRRPRQHTYKESQCRRSRRLVDDPRAVGPKRPWRRPGAAGLPSRTLAAGLPF